MPIGGGKEFVVINQAMAASNDAGNPGAAQHGGPVPVNPSHGSVSKDRGNAWFCAYADKEGDQIFEQCDFLPGALTIAN